jgi:hypothetical protein
MPLLPPEDDDPPVPDDELLSLEPEDELLPDDDELLSLLPVLPLLLWAKAGPAKSSAADIIPMIFFMRGSFRSRIAAKLGASIFRGNKEAGMARPVRPMPVRTGVPPTRSPAPRSRVAWWTDKREGANEGGRTSFDTNNSPGKPVLAIWASRAWSSASGRSPRVS